MKYGTCLMIVLLYFGCNTRKIEKVVVTYTAMGTYDSTEFVKPAELKIFQDFMDHKVAVPDQFKTQYSLMIRYQDGKTEEYFGNGPFIKNGFSYTVRDAADRKRFTDLVYSGLPDSAAIGR